jgi:molybdate transport system permease protein
MLTPAEIEIILLSLKVSMVAILIAAPFAFAIAWMLARLSFPGKLLIDALVHLPLVVPPVVTGWMLLLLLGPGGPVGSWTGRWLGLTFMFHWTGAAAAAAVMAFPLMVRGMRLAIESVDIRLENAARTLGASRWVSFLHVTLPLSVPGIAAGLVLGFARSLGEFGATITFVSSIPGETRTLPLAIYSTLQMPGSEQVAARLALLSVALSLTALLLSEMMVRRSGAKRGVHVL